jgi:hypothetical protein
MAIQLGSQHADRPATREAQVLERLVRPRVQGPHAFFFVSGEGTFFPNGVEESSGYVIDRHGSVWSFWTGWDPDRGEVILTEWDYVIPEPSWLGDEEYQRARAAVGLS